MTSHLTIDQWITGHARFSPDKPAIHFKQQTITYGEMEKKIHQISLDLISNHKLQHGDRIAIYALNRPEHFFLIFAAAKLGLIVVPLNWRLSIPELQFILQDCGPKILFADTNFADAAKQVVENLADCSLVHLDGHSDGLSYLSGLAQTKQSLSAEAQSIPNDPLFIVYTSGTTGTPKGAVLTQKAMQCNAQMALHAYDMTSHDHLLNVLPLFHIGGLAIQPLPGFSCGATLTLHDKFDPDEAAAEIGRSRITLMNSVPTVLQAIVQSSVWKKTDLTSLKTISIGSTDVPIPLIEQVHSRQVPLIQIYGATETGPIAIYQSIPNAFTTVGSIGRKGIHCEIKLADANGKAVPEGENGEIWVKGNNILDHYWNNKKATEDNMEAAWFKTGDVAHLDESGNYWFADRIKHVIISGGENIYPAEIERVVRNVPGIGELAVIGLPDEKWGETPTIVLGAGNETISDQAIHDMCASNLARFKLPKCIVRISELPRNAMGKIVSDDLRKHVLDNAT